MPIARWTTTIPLLLVWLTTTPVPATERGVVQEGAPSLSGTWSGSWQPDGRYDAATVRLSVDGGRLSGELVNPEPLDFARVVFDEEDLTLVAEGESPVVGRVRIDVRIEEDTRLNGTLALGDVVGDLHLVKWTFRP